jgi:hypothetical protein
MAVTLESALNRFLGSSRLNGDPDHDLEIVRVEIEKFVAG